MTDFEKKRMIYGIERTCGSCPSQVEATNLLGERVYIRYRDGLLSVGMGETIEAAVQNSHGDDSFLREVDGTTEGYMTTEDMLQQAGLIACSDPETLADVIERCR